MLRSGGLIIRMTVWDIGLFIWKRIGFIVYLLNAHDRGVIACWKPNGRHVVYICPEHGVFVRIKGELMAPCYCGEWGEEYKPEDYEVPKKKKGKVTSTF